MNERETAMNELKKHTATIQKHETTMRDLLNILFRRKYAIIVCVLTISMLTFAFVSLTPDMYESEVKLLVKMGRESMDIIPTRDNNRMISVTSSRSSAIYTEIEILKSRELIEDIIATIGLDTLYEEVAATNKGPLAEILKIAHSLIPEKSAGNGSADSIAKGIEDERQEKMIRYLSKHISIEVGRLSDIITVSFASPDPGFAYLIVSNLTKAFINRHIELHFSNSSFEFFSDQVDQSKIQLEAIEKKIVAVKNNLNISSIAEYRETLNRRLDNLQAQVDQLAVEKISLQSSINTLKTYVAENKESKVAVTQSPDPTLMTQLSDLRVKEKELISKYSEDNVQVKEIRRQIAALNKLFGIDTDTGQSTETSAFTLKDRLQAETIALAALVAKEGELKKLISDAEYNLKKLNDAELEVVALEREREIFRTNYIKYSENLEESRIDQIVQKQNITNIQILQKPNYAIEPMPDLKMRNFLLGILASLAVGIGLALIRNYFDHSIRTPDDIEQKLQLPTLIVIPTVPADAMKLPV